MGWVWVLLLFGDVSIRGGGLPVVVWDVCSSEDFVEGVLGFLRYAYRVSLREYPSHEMIMGWRRVLPDIFGVFEGFPVVIEYPVLGGPERVDFIVVGRGRGLIIEAKAWSGSVRSSGFFVCVGGELRVDPCYQLENYLAKFRYLHSASTMMRMKFEGVVYVSGGQYTDSCRVVMERGDLEHYLDWLGRPGREIDVKAIVEGRYHISQDLINFVVRNKAMLMRNAIRTLLGGGYGPTEDQLRVIDDVLRALESGEDRAFFVRGVSGSGKTLIAITLFFEALGRGYRVLLTYRNNRLLNTLRTALGRRLSGLIRFYSMGPQGRYQGVAEKNFPADRYGPLDLVIYDEAQRMTIENIRISLGGSRVKVYLYDDEQVLVGDEAGLRENFVGIAEQLKKSYSEYELSVPRRVPPSYLRFVRDLLGGRRPDPPGIEFRIFDGIVDMLRALEEKHSDGIRVALVCAFTETPGNKENRGAPDNLRIGYPLCKKYDKRRGCVGYSDLEIYRGLDLEIYWLMDEKTEYPRYWMGQLDPLKYCASVYGAQGFEAEYVGVVWGRDLIWRNNRWMVNSKAITDNVGGRNSLVSIAKRDPEHALRLLKNRYLILLTRGTKGVYVYFEDKKTEEYVKSLLS